MGRRSRPAAVHAVELSGIRAGLRWRRSTRHLDVDTRCVCLDRELSVGARMGKRTKLGPRGQGSRVHCRCDCRGGATADHRMPGGAADECAAATEPVAYARRQNDGRYQGPCRECAGVTRRGGAAALSCVPELSGTSRLQLRSRVRTQRRTAVRPRPLIRARPPRVERQPGARTAPPRRGFAGPLRALPSRLAFAAAVTEQEGAVRGAHTIPGTNAKLFPALPVRARWLRQPLRRTAEPLREGDAVLTLIYA